MGVNTILTHSGRGDQSVEVRSVNPVVMRASTILFKDYDTLIRILKRCAKSSVKKKLTILTKLLRSTLCSPFCRSSSCSRSTRL